MGIWIETETGTETGKDAAANEQDPNMFDGIIDKLSGASSDMVDNALDSALDSTNTILTDSELDPLILPEITIPLSVKIPGGFLGSVSGERVREKVGGIVSQELRAALEKLGPKDLLGV